MEDPQETAVVYVFSYIFFIMLDGFAVFFSIWVAVFLLCIKYIMLILQLRELFGNKETPPVEPAGSDAELQSCDSTEPIDVVNQAVNSETEDTDEAPETAEVLRTAKRVRFEEDVKLQSKSVQESNEETSYEQTTSNAGNRYIEIKETEEKCKGELDSKEHSSNLKSDKVKEADDQEMFYKEESVDTFILIEAGEFQEEENRTKDIKSEPKSTTVEKLDIKVTNKNVTVMEHEEKQIDTAGKHFEEAPETVSFREQDEKSSKTEGLTVQKTTKTEQPLNIKDEKYQQEDDFPEIETESNDATGLKDNETRTVSKSNEAATSGKGSMSHEAAPSGKGSMSHEAAPSGKGSMSHEATADSGKGSKSQEAAPDSGKGSKSQEAAADSGKGSKSPVGALEAKPTVEAVDKKSQKSKSNVRKGKR